MNDIEQFCDQCAAHGVQAALGGLDIQGNIEVLAQACLLRAGQAKAKGDGAQAERLFGAVQYLNYLLMPYD